MRQRRVTAGAEKDVQSALLLGSPSMEVSESLRHPPHAFFSLFLGPVILKGLKRIGSQEK